MWVSWSPLTITMPPYAGSFQDQLSSYVGQLETPDHQQWVKDAIETEKLKQRHLQVVIQHLESEVSNLSKETIRQMEDSMMHVCTVHVHVHAQFNRSLAAISEYYLHRSSVIGTLIDYPDSQLIVH